MRDVALHILGGDLTNLARRRDGLSATEPGPGESLGEVLARLNQEWVSAARRLSPRLIIELLERNGPPLFAYLESLDPDALGGRVSWAGPAPAPTWLDIAREYMERWIHQQHIRDAVGEPGQQDTAFVAPVIAASVYAVPVALAKAAPATRGSIVLRILGTAGSTWSVVDDAAGWRLFAGAAQGPRCELHIDAADWWRVVTLGMTPETARRRARISGDVVLADAALGAVAIIA